MSVATTIAPISVHPVYGRLIMEATGVTDAAVVTEIEQVMRATHGSLDHLDRRTLRREARVGHEAVQIIAAAQRAAAAHLDNGRNLAAADILIALVVLRDGRTILSPTPDRFTNALLFAWLTQATTAREDTLVSALVASADEVARAARAKARLAS